jgi:urease accessory protein
MEPTAFLEVLAKSRSEMRGPIRGEATPGYCRTRLLTVTTVEAATAVVARAHAVAGRPLEPVVEAWKARTPNPVTRARLSERGCELLREAGHTPRLMPRAVALGVIAANGGIDAEDLARMIGFDDVQTVLGDAHPADAHAWTAALVGDVRAMADQVAPLTDPVSIPASGADLMVDAPAH